MAAAGLLPAALAGTWAAALAYGRRAQRRTPGPGDGTLLVFGAGLMRWGPRAGRPTPLLQARLDRAAALFRAGAARSVSCSGGPEEVEAMRGSLEEAGVPAAAIEVDPQGLNTELTLANAAARATRLIAVTSRNHALRVLLESRRQGLDVTVCAAAATPARGPLRWRVRDGLRELLALWWYAARSAAGQSLFDRVPWPWLPILSRRDRMLARVPGRPDPFITIDRFSRTLRVYSGGRVARAYRVGVGTVGRRTPRGEFLIENKLVDPVWHVPDRPGFGALAGTALPAGDPRNRIRARWLGVYGPVGIHGTSDARPTRPSHGCVKMSEADVVDLYERVPDGTPVVIG